MALSPARQMTAALKKSLVPALEQRGYAGRFPRYRRDGAATIDFISVHYDKEGTAFFLEFGTHPRGDKTTSWGEVVPDAELILEHVDFLSRARLQARCGGGSVIAQWFRFGRFDDDAEAYRTLAATVTAMLPQVDAWLESSTVGPNVSPTGS